MEMIHALSSPRQPGHRPAALARLLNPTEPEPLTLEQAQRRLQPVEGEPRHTAVAVSEQGQVAGMADVAREIWLRPGLLRLTLVVGPDWRRQGIGSRLLEEALCFARAQGATHVEAAVRDNAPEALRFAERRGFQVDRHIFESALDLGTFDERPFVGALERARAEGLRFFSLAELGPATEETQHKLYDLNSTTGLDNPANNGFFAPFDEFRRAVLQAPWFRPDGQILAADGEQWVGPAGVAFSPEARYAYNGFTGIRRGYRGRGLAQALKLLAIRWARQQGARCIRTSNDSRNAPMLAINRKLGYRPEPGLYYLVQGLDRHDEREPPGVASGCTGCVAR